MTEMAAAMKTFFREFDLPVYEKDSIPDEVTLPYITYPIYEPRWDVQGNSYCQVFYPKEMLEELSAKADEIMNAIGIGLRITMPGGYLLIQLADQQAQIMTDDGSQSAYISLIVNAYHMPGM